MGTETSVDLRQYLMPKRPCLVCGSKNLKKWTSWEIFIVDECAECGLLFVNPCLNEQGLEIIYRDHHNSRVADVEASQKRKVMYEIDRDFLLETVDHGQILDIGCGGGFFLSYFDSKKWKKMGMEIDPDTVAFAESQFGLEVKLWDSKHIPLPDQSMDVIVFRGSFEHMLYPDLVAQEAVRVLKPNGYVYICAIPNGESFCARIYREKWNQFDAKEHIFLFSQRTLKRLFEPLGTTCVKSLFPYEETPYCNLESDMRQITTDYAHFLAGNKEKMNVSPAFFGNMLNILFRKK